MPCSLEKFKEFLFRKEKNLSPDVYPFWEQGFHSSIDFYGISAIKGGRVHGAEMWQQRIEMPHKLAEYIGTVRNPILEDITVSELLLSRKEIAAVLHISLVTFHDRMKHGLPFHKEGVRCISCNQK